ncbi:MAG: hypothetical protein HQ483_09335 [Rhodospirillales bacterium]|nr:hypothetical protein [Rhodospirillales bacterium]
MANPAKYLFIASMDVEPDKLDIFNEVYDKEHCPMLRKVPGVVAISRLSLEPLKLSMGGKVMDIVAEGEPNFSAFYWIESPEVLVSKAWADAIEEGRWPEQVRPYTKNRRHVLRKVMEPSG